MATCYNITNKLKKDIKQIQIGDDLLTVNTSFDAMLEMEAMLRDESLGEADKMQKSMQILLGADYNVLQAMKLDMEDTKVVFTAIMAIVNGETYEETEARFQK